MKDTTKPLVVYVLNLFDCIVTLWFFSLFGISIESNPFGVALLQNPIITILFKVFVIGLAILLLYQQRNTKIAKIGMDGVLIVYSLTAIYQIILVFIVIVKLI